MPPSDTRVRVLIVDDNRDGADVLGLLVEELGGHAHVTYGGVQALAIAAIFQPDLILVDLVMPDMNGYDLVSQLRQVPAFAHTRILAVTGLKAEADKVRAAKAGCDASLIKPITLAQVKAAMAGIVPVPQASRRAVKRDMPPASSVPARALSIDEARKLRNGRPDKTLTQAESEAVLCDGVMRFQDEYLGTSPDSVEVYFLDDLVALRIIGALTLAERHLVKAAVPEKGRDLIKQTRRQLLDLAAPMLQSLVHEITGVKVVSVHHDISTVTGEEVLLFSLAGKPRFAQSPDGVFGRPVPSSPV